MKKIPVFVLCLLSVFLFDSCSKGTKGPDVSKVEVGKVKIKRLEKKIFNLNSKEDVKRFLDEEPLFSAKYLNRQFAPHDSLVVNNVFELSQVPALDTLYGDCMAEFDDLTWLEDELTDAFKHVKYYYPDFHIPEVCTVISGFGSDLFVSDSLIAIGLEYYLTDKSKWAPQNVPQYMQKRLLKQYLVPSIMVLVSNKYNAQDGLDRTILAEMVFYGKAYEFAKKMIPAAHDTLVFGFTEEQRLGCHENADIIWGHFVQNDLFYETSRFVAEKYVGERPAVLEIGNECPGRIGRWLGWQIVRAYEERLPEKSWQDIMAEKSAKGIFEGSQYKPQMSYQ